MTLRVILLGPPGAGKGTQADWICKQYKVPKLSTGDMLRAAVGANSTLGRDAKSIMNAGGLVPDSIINALMLERIGAPDCVNGFLLDGYPRTIPQANFVLESNFLIDLVLDLTVADDVIIKRLTGRRIHLASGRVYHLEYSPPKMADKDDITGEPLVQRDDDTEATVKKRLTVYHEKTKPLIDLFQSAAKSEQVCRYVRVDASQSVEQVRDAIFKLLD